MRQDSFNLTAYRILKILLWLEQEPLTLDTINSRFDTDPLIDKTLSQDSIGLYLNTLKAIGCEISRPTSTNGYQYELKYQPFSYELTHEHIQFFQQLLQNIATLHTQQISFDDYFKFYQWMAKVIENSSNHDKQRLTEEILGAAYAIPYKDLSVLIEEMRLAIENKSVLDITYLSPTQNINRKTFLPIRFHHNRGLFYVMGCTLEHSDLVMFRLERIMTYEQNTNTKQLSEQLLKKYLEDKTYIIRLLNATPEHYSPFNETDTVIVDPNNMNHVIVKLASDNSFLLKQHLLNHGFAFQILYPQALQDDVLNELRSVQEVYAA